MTRRFKTGENNRKSYIYYQDKGEGSKRIVLKPGQDGVTEVMIKFLHDEDDAEFDNNRREHAHREGKPKYLEEDDVPVDPFANIPAPKFDVDEYIDRKKRRELVLEGMKILTPAQQELIHEVFTLEKTNTEIAAEQGVTEAAIRNRLKKIYARLRKFIETRGFD